MLWRAATVSGLFVFLLGVGLVLAQTNGGTGVITGTVAYRQRIALPQNATVGVRLEDVSLMDAPASNIAEVTVATEGRQVPIAFELKYDPAQIVASHRYNLRATISANGQMLFTTTTSNPVITGGAPLAVNLMLEQTTGSAQAMGTPSANPVTLEGTYWKLVELRGKPAVKGVGNDEAYLLLHAKEKHIAGSSGCNHLVGGYDLNGDSLHFTPAGITMMACSPALMKQEQTLSGTLQATTGFQITGRSLELLAGDQVAARFQAKYLK